MDMSKIKMPPAPPIRPDKSLAAFFGLMRNKEETSYVFDFSYNINGGMLHRTFERFARGPFYEQMVNDRRAIFRALDDRQRLRELPVGTVGRTYADFMDREGLDTDGVAQSFRDKGLLTEDFEREYPEYSAFTYWLNITHDMFHVLTGYNRDSLGELALLNFTSKITGNRGNKYLARMGAIRVKLEDPSLPVFKVVNNGGRMGRASADLLHVNFIDLLDRRLREVREELNIVPCPVYAALPQERLLALVQPQAA
ncbi:Coq4 family protein [Parvularcula lutaonensis]|uniref:Coq4 family protein n=1 Tax=Parvularcula lutaonensis TaxID=491923 RepID=A0ABV7M8V7_9PROT|nr:Coq4 family protein [Parvularcula lutaonensis]GGY44978.1 hypothetical protein GCM10007148_12420 [Parvularcula lutaonensis]